MLHPVEEKIIQLIEKKDKAFVSLLYDHYADSLFGIIISIVKDESVAQDVLQESFMKIWKRADQYNPQKARLFTWLLAICRNTAIDKLRSSQKRASREVQIDDSLVNIGTSSFNPATIDLKDLLGHLEEKNREVLEALFFQGLTQQEASEALSIPLGTVKTRLKISLRELRKIFGDDALFILFILILL